MAQGTTNQSVTLVRHKLPSIRPADSARLLTAGRTLQQSASQDSVAAGSRVLRALVRQFDRRQLSAAAVLIPTLTLPIRSRFFRSRLGAPVFHLPINCVDPRPASWRDIAIRQRDLCRSGLPGILPAESSGPRLWASLRPHVRWSSGAGSTERPQVLRPLLCVAWHGGGILAELRHGAALGFIGGARAQA